MNSLIYSALVMLLLSPFANAREAEFIGLGDLPGGQTRSEAQAISADGSTVVGTSFSKIGPQAFRWTRTGGMVVLGAEASQALDVSADGKVVVGCLQPTTRPQAFCWTAGEGMMNLAGKASTSWSQANSVSADGKLVVGTMKSDLGRLSAFRWESEAGAVSFKELSGENQGSESRAVTADGLVVVGTFVSRVSGASNSPRQRAFRWTNHTGMLRLDSANQHVDLASEATDTTPDGNVIVGKQEIEPFRQEEAFLWTRYAGMVHLGFLPEGNSFSKATAVSDDGSVVVGTASAEFGVRAFVWDEANGMRNLQDLLAEEHGLKAKLAGWKLIGAEEVSADGSVIVGRGVNPAGNLEGWVAVIPQPQ